MENPPWVSKSDEVKEIHRNTIVSMEIIGSKILVIPLVDNSSILNDEIKLHFFEFISNIEKSLPMGEPRPRKLLAKSIFRLILRKQLTFLNSLNLLK